MDYTQIGGLAGVIAPIIAAIINQPWMPKPVRQVIPIVTAIVLTVIGLLLVSKPETGEQIITAILVAVGVMQTVFVALRKAGLNLIEEATELPRHRKTND